MAHLLASINVCGLNNLTRPISRKSIFTCYCGHFFDRIGMRTNFDKKQNIIK